MQRKPVFPVPTAPAVLFGLMQRANRLDIPHSFIQATPDNSSTTEIKLLWVRDPDSRLPTDPADVILTLRDDGTYSVELQFPIPPKE